MTTPTTNNTWISRSFIALIILACALFAACNGTEDGTETGTDSEFSEAIPSTEMLALSLSGDGTETSEGGLRVAEGAIVGDPAAIAGRAQEVVDRVNRAVTRTHEVLDSLREGIEPIQVEDANRTCQVWQRDGEVNQWRLISCREDRAARRYGFALMGRPLGSTDDADFMPVAGGQGAILPSFEGRRRGAGKIGYNFNALNALTGEGPTGVAAIGYRAAGPYRHLVVGLNEFQAEGDDTPRSALYDFRRVRGEGGRLRFALHADFLTMDDEGGLAQGQDSLVEVGRAALAWRSDGRARTAAIACNGTVGEGECVRMHQCWDASGSLTFEALDQDENAAIEWEPTACPSDAELPLDDTEPPADGDVMPPANEETEGVSAPNVDEPPADPSFEDAR